MLRIMRLWMAVAVMAGVLFGMMHMTAEGMRNLPATPTPTALPVADLSQVCRETIDNWTALVPSGGLPENLMEENAVRSPSDFDVNTLFQAFDHLSMRDGMVLDYVYYYDGFGGFPILYARPVNQEPYSTASDYYQAAGENPPDFRDDVVIDGTPEGYLQFALFDMLASQFYLFWHAGYGMVDVVCDAQARDEMVDTVNEGNFGAPFPAEDAAAARKLDVTPVVQMNKDTVTVEVVYFSHWGGFIRQKISIPLDGPLSSAERQQDTLVPYVSGVVF